MSILTADQIAEATHYNRSRGIAFLPEIDADVGSVVYAQAVAAAQKRAVNLVIDGKAGPVTASFMRGELLNKAGELPVAYDDVETCLTFVSQFEGSLTSCNRDGEYRGLFDRPPEDYHSASKNKPGSDGWHVGLSYGFIQFTQDGGALGQVLQRTADLNGYAFQAWAEYLDSELLDVVTAKGTKRVNGRSPRVQPVGGADLWEEPWLSRFRNADKHPVWPHLKQAQFDVAARVYLKGAMDLCDRYGFRSQRALCMATDRCIQYGVSGADRHLFAPTRANNPLVPEHDFLRIMAHKYHDRRWGHRLETIFRSAELGDMAWNWSDVQLP